MMRQLSVLAKEDLGYEGWDGLMPYLRAVNIRLNQELNNIECL
jgi:hypothetical protein